MQILTLLAMGLTAVTATTLKRDAGFAQVSSITNLLSSDATKDANTAAIIAFFPKEPCDGSAQFLKAENATCYGPIGKTVSWKVVDATDGCIGE